ncbi:uncharacterized protein LOC121393371 isoform X1 [Xenopus laevis]|uniref:Uncharacterized protein LOC121393371 isoform X1 n=1 Tax=Xenopus laevis TaxID=8355 RepID=A0A8J1KN65_XENLA|nr:uncharacterized protein LOC121393371 isoform X1 [Xenopus laevis]
MEGVGAEEDAPRRKILRPKRFREDWEQEDASSDGLRQKRKVRFSLQEESGRRPARRRIGEVVRRVGEVSRVFGGDVIGGKQAGCAPKSPIHSGKEGGSERREVVGLDISTATNVLEGPSHRKVVRGTGRNPSRGRGLGRSPGNLSSGRARQSGTANDRGPAPTNDRGPAPTNDRGPASTNDKGSPSGSRGGLTASNANGGRRGPTPSNDSGSSSELGGGSSASNSRGGFRQAVLEGGWEDGDSNSGESESDGGWAMEEESEDGEWGTESAPPPAGRGLGQGRARGGCRVRLRGNGRVRYIHDSQRQRYSRGFQYRDQGDFDDYGGDEVDDEYFDDGIYEDYDDCSYYGVQNHSPCQYARRPRWVEQRGNRYSDNNCGQGFFFRNKEEEDSWRQWRKERREQRRGQAGSLRDQASTSAVSLSVREESRISATSPAVHQVQKEGRSSSGMVGALAGGATTCNILILGHSFIFWAMKHAGVAGQQMGLPEEHMKIAWLGKRGMRWEQLRGMSLGAAERNPIDLLIIHAGGNDLTSHRTPALIENMKADLTDILSKGRIRCVAWSDMIPRSNWRGASSPKGIEKVRKKVNRAMHKFMCSSGGGV